MEITKDKEYTTRDDREVRIYADDGGGDYPIHGAYKTDEGWVPTTWTRKGLRYKTDVTNHPLSLIEKPKTKKVWIEVYMDFNGCIHADEYYTKAGALGAKEDTEEAGSTHLEIIEREYPIGK